MAQSLRHWLEFSQALVARTIDGGVEVIPSTHIGSQGKKKVEEEELASPKDISKEEEAKRSLLKYLEKTKRNKDEQMRKVKEELQNKPVVSEQRRRWEEIMEQKKAREMRTKAQKDPKAQKERQEARVEHQRETTKRISLAELQRNKIQDRLKRKVEEEAAC